MYSVNWICNRIESIHLIFRFFGLRWFQFDLRKKKGDFFFHSIHHVNLYVNEISPMIVFSLSYLMIWRTWTAHFRIYDKERETFHVTFGLKSNFSFDLLARPSPKITWETVKLNLSLYLSLVLLLELKMSILLL